VVEKRSVTRRDTSGASGDFVNPNVFGPLTLSLDDDVTEGQSRDLDCACHLLASVRVILASAGDVEAERNDGRVALDVTLTGKNQRRLARTDSRFAIL
jgi:hypothetical protein